MWRVALVVLLLASGCGRQVPRAAAGSITRAPAAPEPARPAPAPTITTEALSSEPDVVQPVALGGEPLVCGNTRGLSVGMAVLEATITPAGTVENIRVIRSLSPETDAALKTCISRWRYKPATYKGKPVSVQLSIAVNICA